MGRQILLPTTALNSSTSSILNSDTINAIPSFSSNNLNFNPDPNLEDPVIYEEKIEVDVEVQDKLDLLIDEAKTWNAKDTFIQHVVMRVSISLASYKRRFVTMCKETFSDSFHGAEYQSKTAKKFLEF